MTPLSLCVYCLLAWFDHAVLQTYSVRSQCITVSIGLYTISKLECDKRFESRKWCGKGWRGGEGSECKTKKEQTVWGLSDLSNTVWTV